MRAHIDRYNDTLTIYFDVYKQGMHRQVFDRVESVVFERVVMELRRATWHMVGLHIVRATKGERTWA